MIGYRDFKDNSGGKVYGGPGLSGRLALRGGLCGGCGNSCSEGWYLLDHRSMAAIFYRMMPKNKQSSVKGMPTRTQTIRGVCRDQNVDNMGFLGMVSAHGSNNNH